MSSAQVGFSDAEFLVEAATGAGFYASTQWVEGNFWGPVDVVIVVDVVAVVVVVVVVVVGSVVQSVILL